MKKPYEKPVINKLHTGLMNKFGRSPAYSRKVRTEIDQVSIEELVSKYGSPDELCHLECQRVSLGYPT